MHFGKNISLFFSYLLLNLIVLLYDSDNIVWFPLQFNGVDLRSATLEQACSELSKGNSKVTILAQYNIASKCSCSPVIWMIQINKT